jgi:predicted DNA-binding mobile mystery protein A
MKKKSRGPRLIIPLKSPEMRRLYQRQITDRLEAWMPARKAPPPKSGWIATIRQALGMSRTQLARRMGVDPTAIPHLERREAEGKITLDSLRRAARAMDAELVYAIIPNQSLSATLLKQAEKVAKWRLGRIRHTMRLEDQDVDPDEANFQEAELVQKLLTEHPQALWDDPDTSSRVRPLRRHRSQ